VAKGKFHIYPIGSVEQGIEILTGVPAGQRTATGKFEVGTVFAKVDARLRTMADIQKKFE
jgi:hypothetical protein